MFRSGTLLLAILASAATNKIGIEADKQGKVLYLFRRLGYGDVSDHVAKPFPFNDPNLYSNENALRNFTAYYEEGFLEKDGIFSPYDLKTNRDTSSLADLFYFAKDFNILYKIARWAKSEINPVQYFYGLTSALLHRQDTTSVVLPPAYEVLPNYFVPSSVINAAYRAKLNGVIRRKFQVNNTGWENGRGFTYDRIFKQTNQDYFDYETILSYYREDVARSDFFFKYFKKMDQKMNDESKYGYKLERLEEWYLTVFKWIVTRYNIERYALGLPPVRPFNFQDNIYSGYDSQLVDLYGHHLSARPDNIKPFDVDPQGSSSLIAILRRFQDDIEGRNNHMVKWSNGIKNITRDMINDSGYYSSMYHNILGFIDRLSSSSSNKYFQGILQNNLTRMRDPVYYQILAYLVRIIRNMESYNEPYSKEELIFPGVKITNVSTSKLETYFEYYDFEISDAVPGNEGKYIASQLRINHKPFSLTLNIESDVQTKGIAKVFLGYQKDTLNRTLSLNQLRESFTLMDTFAIELKQGENEIERQPGQSELTSNTLRFEDIYKVIKSSPIRQTQCSYPSHLLLPKGSSTGTPFKLFVIVYPSGSTEDQTGIKKTCGRNHLTEDKTHSLPFPVDKPWLPLITQQPNLKFTDVFIYHSDN